MNVAEMLDESDWNEIKSESLKHLLINTLVLT